MDRLIEAVAEYLCRHKSVGLLRLTLDLTRRRLDIFAEIGAAEVVKGAVSPPTPGTETWWRAAVREAVYVLRERGLVQYVREAVVVNWTGSPCRQTDPTKPPTAKNGVLFRLFLVFAFARRRRMAPRLYPTPNEMNVKRGLKPTAEKTKNQRKT
jgi:hypothetical protein